MLLALLAVLPSACNRGSHPAQLNIPAPDFTVSDGASSIHLASYRGKVVLLNFWGTWCAPCIEELPSLIQLHHDMPSLSIVGVAVPPDEGVSEDPAEYKAFITRHHIDFANVRDTNESAPKLFHTEMWPETYVIDRNGVIRRKFVGPQDWTSPEIRSFLSSL
jgi:cytochrome c biogenesis protein CcmG, thiol:disulfide interchange protein DsbE